MKHIKRIQLFAHADEFDRLAGDSAHRKRRTAARIAIHPGEDDTGKRHLLAKGFRDIHRILPSKRIDHQQRFRRRGNIRDCLHLVHQRLINVQAARRI